MLSFIYTGSMLKHYGIKGMEWGKRLYQYKDGSLTLAGKKRYSTDRDTNSKNTSNLQPSLRLKEAIASSKKLINASVGPRLKEAATSSEKLINASVGPRLKEAMASSKKLLSMKIEAIPDKNKKLGEKFVSSIVGGKNSK